MIAYWKVNEISNSVQVDYMAINPTVKREYRVLELPA